MTRLQPCTTAGFVVPFYCVGESTDLVTLPQLDRMRIHLTGNCPQEGSDLPGDCDNHDRIALALGHQAADRAHSRVCAFQAMSRTGRAGLFAAAGDHPGTCRVTVGPGRLNKHLAGAAVACLGDPPWRLVSPVERSDGTRPRNAIS